MKHTQGKWIASKPEKSNGWWHVTSLDRIPEICTCYCYDSEANAKLISAAPELLEALKKVLHDPNKSEIQWMTLDFIEAAIKNAES